MWSITRMESGVAKLPINSRKLHAKESVPLWFRALIKIFLSLLEAPLYLPKPHKFLIKVLCSHYFSICPLPRPCKWRSNSRPVYHFALHGQRDDSQNEKVEKRAVPVDAQKGKGICTKARVQDIVNPTEFDFHRNENPSFAIVNGE